MSVLGIVQARMGSTRLPGKVLRELGGRSVLAWVVRAARDSGVLDDLVVATTADAADDPVVVECERLDVAVYRGPAEDVLARFVGALSSRPADWVVRFTGDCPLLDPEIVAMLGAVLRSVPDVDYVSTHIAPRLPLGMNVEAVRADVLRAVDRVAAGHHRTHVTSYVWSHPQDFRILGLTLPPDRSGLRVTLDTPEDWSLLRAVVEHFGDSPVPLGKLVSWLSGHPRIRQLNARVVPKALELG
jgi:spore coat polysaccharide biosynthesis protein SpsF